jgi:cyclophilin family peptidyl-prolyl cis-trans isomerase
MFIIIGAFVIAAIIAAIVIANNRKGKSNMDESQAQNVSQDNTPAQPPIPVQTPVQSQTQTTQTNASVPQTTAQISLPQGYTIPEDCKTIDFKNDIAVLNTTMGTIKFQMYTDDAPLAVVNFDCLIKRGYYNGVTFHRILKDLAIQGGDPTGTGMGGQSAFGKAFADELNPNTKSFQTGYVAGVLAMANSGPNTNGSQFFIIPTDQAKAAFAPSYTIFGHVISGMDVVAKMNAAPITPVTSTMDGKPTTPIDIVSATLESAPAK